ncbi:MAG TPA: MMPL family transporter [Burkholderiaceae bacterium]
MNNKKLRAWAWLLIVLAMATHVGWLLASGRLQLDTDVLAMLPQDERQPAVQQATRALTDAAARRVVVLVGGQDEASAQRAGDAYAESLVNAPVDVRYRVGDAAADQWLSFFEPHRHQLLSDAQRRQLESQSAEQLAQAAVEQLYRPMGMPRIGPWAEDPLNLFGAWLGERAADSKVRVTDGRLSLTDGDKHYALLMLELRGSAFSMSAQQALVPQLNLAREAALRAAPGQMIYAIGVPLYAAAAATQAEHEIHTIGIGSLLGIVALTWFAFKALRPRVLVTLSIATGLLAAVSVSSLLFERLHMITLVFGASLVGVAENYASNYFSGRSGRPFSERFAMLGEQAPVMWLAMLTTAIGYALLALTPFPGLRQIAVFSVVGLLAAFISTLWWFPLLDKGEMPFTRFSRWIGSQRARWPALGANRLTLALALLLIAVLTFGGMRMRANDDIRLLQNTPSDLITQQRAIGRLMDLPSPAQFYLVRGDSEEQLLQREEALKAAVRASGLADVQAVSDWLPSQKQQNSDASLIDRSQRAVLAQAPQLLGEPIKLPAPSVFRPLLPAAWLAAPVSEPLRHQWLGPFEGGYASVVMLRGVSDPAVLPKLAALVTPGVQWVDKVAEVSSVMARTRQLMAAVIGVSYALVFVALTVRFGRRAWRALLPTALASALALALPALFGQPLQLFNVLALLLILGMGVDYGIFMLEQPARTALRPFLSITLAAASTLLAFGLLALSETPALRAFGLTMLLGISLAWLMTPLFLPTTATKETP